MGHGCLATRLAGEEGLFVAGAEVCWPALCRRFHGWGSPGEVATGGQARQGTGRGRSRLAGTKKVRNLFLDMVARWGPVVGAVGDSLAVAGGGDWGTTTTEFFSR